MSRLADVIQSAGYGDRILTDGQLARILGGSDASRYGLVNRALKDGALIRVRRGLYALAPKYGPSFHPFVVAQSIKPGSYISFESALSYHGWIPEAVYTTASVTTGRKSDDFETETFGHYSFHPLALETYGFYASVSRVKLGESYAMVAQPLRGLMDLVALRKIEWTGMAWIDDGLRIDQTDLITLRRSDFRALSHVYKHKRVREFLKVFETELFELKSNSRR